MVRKGRWVLPSRFRASCWWSEKFCAYDDDRSIELVSESERNQKWVYFLAEAIGSLLKVWEPI